VRPLIGITTWRRHLPTFVGPRTLLYTLADEYVGAVADAGATPLLIPHLRDDRDVTGVLDSVAGLVVAGGGDVHPDSYGAHDEGSVDIDLAADRSELALVRGARATGLPTLAICRGMQLMAVAAGGRLRQEITAPGGVHEPAPYDAPGTVLRVRHRVTIRPGTRLAAALGPGQRSVSSIHHQAIAAPPDGYVVTATAPDGIIEGIEPSDGWDAIGVQWHPEKLDGADAGLFAWLIDAAASIRRPGDGATARDGSGRARTTIADRHG
jgi:putative glutamine amidotransferase